MNTRKSSLDDLYRMTAYVYSEQNAIRPLASTFSHFVEVCGMLTVHDRRKRKEGLDFMDALCKALGWYFPLLAKLNVRSAEELIFRKFPFACPYCRLAPHEDRVCKTVRGTDSTVNHAALRRVYEANSAKRPHTLDQWQQMFHVIYPRSLNDAARSTLGLFEELGELAEAVRVFERFPKYFAGEAADVFSYLMGLANEHAPRLEQETGESFNLHDEYLKRFPGLCLACGHRICVCPSIPKATVGRMAKELDIGAAENLFASSADSMLLEGNSAALDVLREIGGIPKIVQRFPADRGDANAALIALLLKLAVAIEKIQPELSDRFNAAAIELSGAVSEPGSKLGQSYLATHDSLMTALRDAWRSTQHVGEPSPISLEKGSLAFSLGEALARVRILIVHASPTDEVDLRVSTEVREIRAAIQLAGRQREIEIDDLPAATTDDLRRALLSKEYEIVHFAGHANSESIVLENRDGLSAVVKLADLAELLTRHPSVRCVVLNACESLATLTASIAPFTVGMEVSVDDQSAIEFAVGFYDAVARGKDIEFAVAEGKDAARLKQLAVPVVKVLRRT
jgi:NTP pyrophosphatase (non-canonical NTP hydrolase)